MDILLTKKASGLLKSLGRQPTILNINKATDLWLKDTAIRRLFKNAGYLISGNILASGLGLATAALTARALGPEFFGVLVLIQAYTRLIDQVLNFQSWQALIKYATEALEQRRYKDFEALLALGTLVDVGSAWLGTAIAILILLWFGPLIGIDDRYLALALLYTAVILFNPIGTSQAILRMFNRFNVIAAVNSIGSFIKLIAVGGAYLVGAEFPTFVLIYIGTDVFQQLLLIALGWYTVRKNGFPWALNWPGESIWRNLTTVLKMSRSYQGLWGFMINTNLSSTARLIINQGDILLIGYLLGPSAAGIYKIAMLLVMIVRQVSDPIFQAIYPEISRLIATERIETYRALVTKVVVSLSLYVAFVWLALALFGKPLIDLVFGYEYLEAWKPALIYLAGMAFALLSVYAGPTLWALGKTRIVLAIEVTSSILYIPILYLSVFHYGLIGAAMAFLIWGAGQSLVRIPVANHELSRYISLKAQRWEWI